MRYRGDLRLREAAERRSGRENGEQADVMALCFKHGSTSAPRLRSGGGGKRRSKVVAQVPGKINK